MDRSRACGGSSRLTMRSEIEPSAVSLLQIARDHDGGLTVNGRSWQEDGTLSARYWSEVFEGAPGIRPSIFYFWRGERPRHPNAPQLEGTGEIKLFADHRPRHRVLDDTVGSRCLGCMPEPPGIYLRAAQADLQMLDSGSEDARAKLIAQRLSEWKSVANAF